MSQWGNGSNELAELHASNESKDSNEFQMNFKWISKSDRFHRYAGGSGIALPFGFLNTKGSGIGYAGGSGIDSKGMPEGLA